MPLGGPTWAQGSERVPEGPGSPVSPQSGSQGPLEESMAVESRGLVVSGVKMFLFLFKSSHRGQGGLEKRGLQALPHFPKP